MTRFDMIKKLEEVSRLCEEVDSETTDFAKEHSYICIRQAIGYLEENYDPKEFLDIDFTDD